MMRRLHTEKVPISARRDQADLESLFGEEAAAEVLRFIKNTKVGRPLVKEENKDDYWDVEQLDQESGKEEVMVADGGQ